MAAKKRVPTPPSDKTRRATKKPSVEQPATETPKPPRRTPAAPRAAKAQRRGRKETQPTATTPEVRETPLRIVMVTPEAHPFAKTGGLAEVMGALPAALVRLGHSVTTVLPRYRGTAIEGASRHAFAFPLGPHSVSGHFVEKQMPDGVTAVLVDVPALFDREGLYIDADGLDYPDNALRFAVLSRAALEYIRASGERPDIIHAHDWQTGIVPVYQKMQFSSDPLVGGVPAIFTIHNLAFQGLFAAPTINAVGLPWDVFHREALEYWGNISFLKGGVNFSEKITTVSPTYAREILTPEYGFGFDGVLARRAADLSGILNGIDLERWNPASDPFVPASYTVEQLEGKREAKRALLRDLELPSDDAALDRPVIGLISRLTDQKGFDLIAAAAGELMAIEGVTWTMLGSGERRYEDLWRTLAIRHPQRVSTTIGFDERLAHLIEAGADMFLMPSRFEPCGLNQQYSLRYGTIPIVRATGGLHDTVRDAQEVDGNGVKFADYSPDALVAAVQRALDLYRDWPLWQRLQRNGMAANPSWDGSAREYVKVYRAASNPGL